MRRVEPPTLTADCVETHPAAYITQTNHMSIKIYYIIGRKQVTVLKQVFHMGRIVLYKSVGQIVKSVKAKH